MTNGTEVLCRKHESEPLKVEDNIGTIRTDVQIFFPLKVSGDNPRKKVFKKCKTLGIAVGTSC